jgi:hypothetical protein
MLGTTTEATVTKPGVPVTAPGRRSRPGRTRTGTEDRTTMITRVGALWAAAMLLVACGSSAPTGGTAQAQPTATSAASSAPSTPSAPTAAPSTVPVPPSPAGNGPTPNRWAGPPADITRLPIGTSKVSLTTAAAGGLLACAPGNPNGGGAHAAGPWLDEAAGTWDLSKKVAVQGRVSWPMATYSEVIDGETRTITGNGVPVGGVTGVFPIAANDPAHAYDRNPNRISAGAVTISLPLRPTRAAEPACLGKGRIGMLRNGVPLFAALDERNRDAVAYETQDACDGHPQQTGAYHYHDVPSCILDAAVGASTVVGFAHDGFPIVVERDARGDLPTNADLDQCHGRTSPIELDGVVVDTYHYSVTREFPYVIGCYAGTPTG